MNKILKTAALNAILTALYIILIASFLFYAQKFLGQKPDTVLAPIVMLCLLVFSASVTGLLIFGKPVLWYLDGKKKEAITLLIYTLGVFLVITVAALCVLFFAKL